MDGRLWYVVVDKGPDGNADNDPEPNLSDHADGLIPTIAQARGELVFDSSRIGVRSVDDVGLEMLFQFEPPQNRPSHSADE